MSARPGDVVTQMPFERHEVVRVGLVGIGRRQSGLLDNWLAAEGASITAVCDLDSNRVEEAAARVTQAGQRPPAMLSSADGGVPALLARDDVDLVCVATPWDQHVPLAVAAMDAGKHVCVEVPAATTLDGCWELVEASERNQRHCVMMENCCYGQNELLVSNLIHAGLLGDLLHGDAAYIHDLRSYLVNGGRDWRRQVHTRRDGNLYPTHGLGPVALYMDINRGDRFDTLVSMSSASRGLQAFRAEHAGPNDPAWGEEYVCGDVNTSLIRTVAGRTIMLQHQVANPRPYDRFNRICGTKGAFQDFPPRIFLDGQDGPEEYTDLEPYRNRFEHRLWRDQGDEARRLAGHGGMDFLMIARLVDCMRAGICPDTDVYDAAAWSAPGPLSDQSVANGSAPVSFPDFTRGNWSTMRGTLVETTEQSASASP